MIRLPKRKYKIESAIHCYENLRVKINGEWYYMKMDKLVGVKVEGELVTKKVRKWLI
jgi:hypothetical protein